MIELRDAIDAHLRGKMAQRRWTGPISPNEPTPQWKDEPNPDFRMPNQDWRPKPKDEVKTLFMVTRPDEPESCASFTIERDAVHYMDRLSSAVLTVFKQVSRREKNRDDTGQRSSETPQ